MKVKGSEKVGLKLNIQKTKIMASGPIREWSAVGKLGAGDNKGIAWGDLFEWDGNALYLDCSSTYTTASIC